LVGGEVITLSGEMGVGKTVFAKGLADGLGVKEDVLSPTYTIMNEYESGRLKLYHYDAYRLTSGDEAVETGLADYFGEKDGVCLIEWAENVRSALPTGLIKIEIKYTGENLREITVNDK
jgi:tRNA threonylcarbamoyladenosine biosynthesis protein TsaE